MHAVVVTRRWTRLHYSLPTWLRFRTAFRKWRYDLRRNGFGDGLRSNRFYDLMRFAFRRGEDFLASRVARRNNPDMPTRRSTTN